MADVAYAPAQVANLPSADTTVRLPGWVDAWLRRGSPVAFALAIGLPPFAFVNSLLIAITGDACEYPCDGQWLYGVVSYAAIITFWILAMATVIARASAKRHVKDRLSPFAGLGQGAKDWYVRGDITEAEYEQIKAAVEPAIEGKSEAQRIKMAASLLTSVAALSALFLGPLVFISILVVVEEAESFFAVVGFPLFTLFLAFLAVSSLAVGIRAHRVARELTQQLLEGLRRLEEEILKTAHQRARKAPTPSAPSNPYGPSFRSYTGR